VLRIDLLEAAERIRRVVQDDPLPPGPPPSQLEHRIAQTFIVIAWVVAIAAMNLFAFLAPEPPAQISLDFYAVVGTIIPVWFLGLVFALRRFAELPIQSGSLSQRLDSAMRFVITAVFAAIGQAASLAALATGDAHDQGLWIGTCFALLFLAVPGGLTFALIAAGVIKRQRSDFGP